MQVKLRELFDLHGKVALVTGSRNWGYDAAAALSEMGARVVITSRNQNAADAAARKLKEEEGVEGIGARLEVPSAEDWSKLVEHVVACKFPIRTRLYAAAANVNPIPTRRSPRNRILR